MQGYSEEYELTNQYESQSNHKGEHVATQRFIVLAISFCKHLKTWVDIVLAQSLGGRTKKTYYDILQQYKICKVFNIFTFAFTWHNCCIQTLHLQNVYVEGTRLQLESNDIYIFTLCYNSTQILCSLNYN